MRINSVSEPSLFGRKNILALLEKRVASFQSGFRQNIGFVGPTCIGKSLLLHKLIEFVNPNDVLVVPFSCQDSDSFERFSQRWMSEILFSVYQTSGKPLPGDFQALFHELRPLIPKTLRRMKAIKKMTLQARYANAFRELLAVSGTVSKETGKKILFVLDDFDRLSSLPVNDPFAALGNEMMLQKDTMYVVSSSRVDMSRSIFSEKLSLLFGNFEVIELKTFDFQEANVFMENHLSDRLVLDDQTKQFIIRLTDGHPYYLSLLLDRMRHFSAFNGSGVSNVLLEALTDELYRSSGRLHQHFLMKIYKVSHVRPWTCFADVLLAISLGNKKILQMARFLHLKSNDMKKALERLAQAEVIEKHGTLHLIRDPLFRFWLSKVYYRMRFMSQRAPQASSASFTEDVREMMAECAAVETRELPRRMEDLFRTFHNDVVSYEQRKLRCPHFTEVTSRPNNGRVFPVFARNAQTRWLCQILVSRVTEEDIQTFRQDLKRLRGAVQRKLIIGLRGIDLNAKLLAQEAKIQYLDLRQLNFLMDVFDQPKFVL